MAWWYSTQQQHFHPLAKLRRDSREKTQIRQMITTPVTTAAAIGSAAFCVALELLVVLLELLVVFFELLVELLLVVAFLVEFWACCVAFGTRKALRLDEWSTLEPDETALEVLLPDLEVLRRASNASHGVILFCATAATSKSAPSKATANSNSESVGERYIAPPPSFSSSSSS